VDMCSLHNRADFLRARVKQTMPLPLSEFENILISKMKPNTKTQILLWSSKDKKKIPSLALSSSIKRKKELWQLLPAGNDIKVFTKAKQY